MLASSFALSHFSIATQKHETVHSKTPDEIKEKVIREFILLLEPLNWNSFSKHSLHFHGTLYINGAVTWNVDNPSRRTAMRANNSFLVLIRVSGKRKSVGKKKIKDQQLF